MKNVGALPIATIIAIILLVVGGVEVVQDDLSFKEYMESAAVLVGLLGIGRGFAARQVD